MWSSFDLEKHGLRVLRCPMNNTCNAWIKASTEVADARDSNKKVVKIVEGHMLRWGQTSTTQPTAALCRQSILAQVSLQAAKALQSFLAASWQPMAMAHRRG